MVSVFGMAWVFAASWRSSETVICAFVPSSVCERKVSDGHTEVVGRTLNT